MDSVRYRIVGPGLPPRRTELAVPGWAGEAEPRANGSREHPWQCVPFSEGVRMGVEVLFPFQHEARVSKRGGALFLETDANPEAEDASGPPIFTDVGGRFYLFPFTLDLKPPRGWAIRTEPHPRFYTDATDTVPIALPGLVRTGWWPSASTIVFKAPPEGGTHVFRPGEPFVQVIFCPEEADYELAPMAAEEAAERELQSRRIDASREALAAPSRWVSASDIEFDGAYRHMLRAAKARDRAKVSGASARAVDKRYDADAPLPGDADRPTAGDGTQPD